ncbi:hypothetical protein GCM10027403_20220 [Arthrobacter tecti]
MHTTTRFQVLPRADKIVHIRWDAGCALDKRDAHSLIQTLTALGGESGRVDRLLIDMGAPASIAYEARMMFWAATCMNRLAILGQSSMDRVLVAFALASPVPTRFFLDEDAALAWLHSD